MSTAVSTDRPIEILLSDKRDFIHGLWCRRQRTYADDVRCKLSNTVVTRVEVVLYKSDLFFSAVWISEYGSHVGGTTDLGHVRC